SLILLIISAFLPPGLDRLLFFFYGLSTTLLSLFIRFNRWRQFKRGIPQHSFYLGDSSYQRLIPAFLRKGSKWERNVEPLLAMAAGALLLPYLPHVGEWLIFSAFCLACVEHATAFREVNQRLDLLDGMVHSEIQAETV